MVDKDVIFNDGVSSFSKPIQAAKHFEIHVIFQRGNFFLSSRSIYNFFAVSWRELPLSALVFPLRSRQ